MVGVGGSSPLSPIRRVRCRSLAHGKPFDAHFQNLPVLSLSKDSWQAILKLRIMDGRSLIITMKFFYTYVLMCSDGDWYIGSTDDIKRRLWEHENGKVTATIYRRPLKLNCR